MRAGQRRRLAQTRRDVTTLQTKSADDGEPRKFQPPPPDPVGALIGQWPRRQVHAGKGRLVGQLCQVSKVEGQ
ncbi:hypothetical protein GGTG_13778 [Gaeumannomyces tritici R3-111a-1]|uniref:Uncharacterized protein n=1 Tax=Gaeumannomyces tritici (strain R3-111a-1) TaxID=644352 RepID=J3PJT8_GAET3|nr:hypothetical protein GGTG_13778 [Gaeumannomyces tritici R3-111a-1]EJT68651.1 hypothetical protein GGTG_13778 [Gaeumannomyces tritici R3-111a-1]